MQTTGASPVDCSLSPTFGLPPSITHYTMPTCIVPWIFPKTSAPDSCDALHCPPYRTHVTTPRHQVRVALHTARELAAALEAGAAAMEVDEGAGTQQQEEGGGAVDSRLAAFDRAINALGEARAAVRALAKANAGG